MTTYQPKPKQGIYDPNYDPRPKTVTVGVSLVTIEEHTFIQDGRTVTCPVDDDITYKGIPLEQCDLDVENILEQELTSWLDASGIYVKELEQEV